jgi:hypothetical protein
MSIDENQGFYRLLGKSQGEGQEHLVPGPCSVRELLTDVGQNPDHFRQTAGDQVPILGIDRRDLIVGHSVPPWVSVPRFMRSFVKPGRIAQGEIIVNPSPGYCRPAPNAGPCGKTYKITTPTTIAKASVVTPPYSRRGWFRICINSPPRLRRGAPKGWGGNSTCNPALPLCNFG